MAWTTSDNNATDITNCTTDTETYRDGAWDDNAETWNAETCGWRLITPGFVDVNLITYPNAANMPNGVGHQHTGILAYCENVNPMWRSAYRLQFWT